MQSLIASGVVGASLGTLLTKNSEPNTPLGALASAAILLTFKANRAAVHDWAQRTEVKRKNCLSPTPNRYSLLGQTL